MIKNTNNSLAIILLITKILDEENFSYSIIGNECVILDGVVISTDLNKIPSDYLNNEIILIITPNTEIYSTNETTTVIYYNNTEYEAFKNILIDQICWKADIPRWFDEKQYLADHPDVGGYYLPDAKNMGFSDRRRLYHHFLLFYYRFLNDDQKLWMEPVDIEFDEKDYEKKHPGTENYYLPWAEENGYTNRQRLYHHYLRFNQKKYNITKICSSEKKYLVKKPISSYHKPKKKEPNQSNKIKCKILVKIPTLSRIDNLFRTLESFQINASNIEDIAFCISANTNDTTTNNQKIIDKLSSLTNTYIYFNNHDTKIEAYNADIDRFDFDILIAASDDMIVLEKCYDKIILDRMNKYFPDLDGVLWFDTGDNEITDTLSILGKKYYDRFNYLYNDIYKGYFCDDEFTQIAYKLGKLIRINKQIIRHDILAHLDMSKDNTYLKSLVYGARDKAVYKIRKKIQFDIAGAESMIYESLPDKFFDDQRNKNDTKWNIYFTKYDDMISTPELYILERMDIDVANMSPQEFTKFSSNYFRNFRMMTPPIIHQIWFGEMPKEIKDMMDTFAKKYIASNPGWRYILWTEDKLNNLDMINKDLFLAETTYDAKSDIARLEILNKFGGWYLDSDFVWLGKKNLSSLIPMSTYGFTISYEKNGTKIGNKFLNKDTTRVANGLIGSTIANPIVAFIIGQLRESYGSNKNKGSVACSGPDFVQSCVDSISPMNISILDSKYFFPCWWCSDKRRNPNYNDHIDNLSLTAEDLSNKYPEAIAYHMGFTSRQ